jgi:hypothetical protein
VVKGSLLDEGSRMIARRIRVKTPYPVPPNRFVGILSEYCRQLPPADREPGALPIVSSTATRSDSRPRSSGPSIAAAPPNDPSRS